MDEDFISIILGSILPSYNTYIASITATSTLLNQVLTPTNLIDMMQYLWLVNQKRGVVIVV